jgi:signal transduction histidine kinase/HPt (histidine-containing phosphotransfer) domain-containing protein
MRRKLTFGVGVLVAILLLFFFVRSGGLDQRGHAHSTDARSEVARAEADLERELIESGAFDPPLGEARRIAMDRAQTAFRNLDEVESQFDERVRAAEMYRLGLYAVSVVLLGWLLHSMHELKRRTRDLDVANHTLEERVEERTHSLSDVNTALQIEVLERQRAEAEARRALAHTETASRTKSEFLANMSHEIRTPMTSILGFSERLLDPGLDDVGKVEAISTIRRNGDYLLKIINDILDISKIEAGKLSIDRVTCSTLQLLDEVYAAMDVRAAIEGIRFSVELVGLLPESIVTDPVRVKQVLINLVGNAIKFTPRGSVVLRVRLAEDDEPKMRFEVRDTGIGMDTDTIARLFQPFMQADSSTTRRFGGTGLGLSISKHLVERLGGDIEIESRLGVGSTFAFTIEIGSIEGVARVARPVPNVLPEPRTSDAQRVTTSLKGVRILLAEDGEDNRRLLSYVLSAVGAEVTMAVDGSVAVEKVCAARDDGKPFEVILMDMQMPVLDGYAATRRLRERGCRTPIIALTAHAMSTDREKCLAAGCDDFCTKPIVRTLFLSTIAKWIGGAFPHLIDPRTFERDEEEDPELLALVQMFVDDLSVDVRQMRRALDEDNREQLAAVAHRLKGSAGSYGFPALTTQAGVLEQRAKCGAAKAELEQTLEQISALCQAARAERQS